MYQMTYQMTYQMSYLYDVAEDANHYISNDISNDIFALYIRGGTTLHIEWRIQWRIKWRIKWHIKWCIQWHIKMTYQMTYHMTYVIHVGKSYTVHHDISHDIYDSHHDISHDIFQHDISYDIYTLYVMSYARICQGSVECWRYVIRYVIRGGVMCVCHLICHLICHGDTFFVFICHAICHYDKVIDVFNVTYMTYQTSVYVIPAPGWHMVICHAICHLICHVGICHGDMSCCIFLYRCMMDVFRTLCQDSKCIFVFNNYLQSYIFLRYQ